MAAKVSGEEKASELHTWNVDSNFFTTSFPDVAC